MPYAFVQARVVGVRSDKSRDGEQLPPWTHYRDLDLDDLVSVIQSQAYNIEVDVDDEGALLAWLHERANNIEIEVMEVPIQLFEDKFTMLELTRSLI